MWAQGRHARLIGLVGRAELNGVEVVLLHFVASRGRWATQCVVSEEKLAVKASNLEPSASLLETLDRDLLDSVLVHLPLADLNSMMHVAHVLASRASGVAVGADWQGRHLSLLELVQGGAARDVIGAARDRLVTSRLRANKGIMGDEIFEAARLLVRSGASAESVRGLWELPSECAELTSHYLYDLCALRDSGDDENEMGWDEDGMSLLHHAALCGAEAAVVGMILAANGDTANEPDAHGFLPLHYAAMCGSSTQVMRMLLERVEDVADVYESAGDCGTLLHLALQGGSGSWEYGPSEPLSPSQNAVATLLLEELRTLAPPPEAWDDFRPPAEERVMGPGWNPSQRYPLHLAARAGAAEPLLAALVSAYPAAAAERDAKPRAADLMQEYGYLPAHYALGAARTGVYSSCRACSREARATLLAAYPFARWPLVDMIRAGPTLLADPVHEHLVLRQLERLVDEDRLAMQESHDPLLHLAVSHAAPLPILSALLRQWPEHASARTWLSQPECSHVVRLLPLHLARTAVAVELLLTAHPTGAREESSGKQPHCEPLTYASRNRAPDEVVQALTHSLGEGDDLDAFGNRARNTTHPQVRKCNACDMRKLWEGFDPRANGLRRLLGGNQAVTQPSVAPPRRAKTTRVPDETASDGRIPMCPSELT